MNIGIPQIIIIVMFSMSLGINLIKHGEKQNSNYNFFITLFAVALESILLWWGGFFG